MSELDLVKLVKLGDKIAFQKIFESYYKRLWAYLFTLCKDQDLSADLAQQAFIALWENREKLDSEKSLKSYLFAIAYNKFATHQKKIKKEISFLEDLKKETLFSINEEDEDFEFRVKKIKLLIESLPERCQEILKLNKIQGLKYREIAEELGISLKTVEAQMRIAFQKIREGFE